MTRIIIAVVAACAVFAIAGPAGASVTAPFASGLGTDVRWALDVNKLEGTAHPTKFVYVRCYVSDNAFDGAIRWRFGADPVGIWAYARPTEKTVYMRGWTCNLAKSAVSKLKHKNPQLSRGEIFGYSTLLHEAIHVQGVDNENTTECLANDGIRWAAMAYGVPKAEANRLSRVAFDLSRITTATKYHSVSGDCQRKLARADWTHFVA